MCIIDIGDCINRRTDTTIKFIKTLTDIKLIMKYIYIKTDTNGTNSDFYYNCLLIQLN